ncbi:MAG: hypothetical protein KDA32_07265 [Phycisphaerales bacterium]|nr:hypothetical protein [Phycisphaerales bacterium]
MRNRILCSCLIACCVATGYAGFPSNDDCADALGLSSTTAIGDTTSATDDIAPTCGTTVSAPGVWYIMNGTGTNVTVTTCFDDTNYDTKLNVYSGDCDNLVCVGGNDDDFGNPDCNFPRGIGFPSTVSFCAETGTDYLILVQGFSGAVGEFHLEIIDSGVACVGACCLGNGTCLDGVSQANCTAQGGSFNGGVSCGAISCEGACCMGDGTCEVLSRSACATAGGHYSGDGTDCGAATCEGACCFNDGSCTDGTRDECDTAGGTFQGFGTSCGSVSCPVRPDNDDCDDAIALSSLNGQVYGDTTLAQADPTAFTCGTTISAPGVWYSIVGNGHRVNITTCFEDTAYDTKLNVYSGSCGSLLCVAGNDDDFGNPDCNFPRGIGLPSTVSICTSDGETYYIFVQGFGGAVGEFLLSVEDTGVNCTGACCMGDGTCLGGQAEADCLAAGGDFGGEGSTCAGISCEGACCFFDGSCDATTRDDCQGRGGTYQGPGTTCASVTCPIAPENDTCVNAIELSSLNTTVSGTNVNAQTDNLGTCGTTTGNVGVWYSLVGTGTQVTVDTCDPNTTYDTKLQVYCGTCNALTCITGNDDNFNCTNGSGLTSEVTFCAQAGATYYILVDGFAGATGFYTMHISSGGSCAATIECLPTGACCVEGDCTVTTEIGCGNLGGSYLGDGTDCGDGGYTGFVTCDNPFENISGTGTLAAFASSGDDQAEEISLPFNFTFYGVSYSSVWVSSNGLIALPPTTEADADDFSNDPIPNAAIPNLFIAPLWDDFNPGTSGDVFVQTLGTAPNRRFIVQWNAVPQFNTTSPLFTFEGILFEGSNAIEFRYSNVAPETPAGDYTIGIENGDGTQGFSVPGSSITNGSCFRIEPMMAMNPCDDQAPCPDMDNSGLVDLSDLARLIAAFGRSVGDPGYDPAPDFDNSGTVDLSDLALLLSLFGLPCP